MAHARGAHNALADEALEVYASCERLERVPGLVSLERGVEPLTALRHARAQARALVVEDDAREHRVDRELERARARRQAQRARLFRAQPLF